MGRWTRNTIKNQDYQLIEVCDHTVEGTLYDHQTKTRVTVQDILFNYLPKVEMSQLFSLNNKIVIQKEDESSYFRMEGIANCLLVTDFSTVQRKQLYNILENKGFKKSLLYKHYTQ